MSVLFAPGPEQVATTNAWAFLHWSTRREGAGPSGRTWRALLEWSWRDPDAFAAAVRAFARPSVMPAKAGIHERRSLGVDSSFRGNDGNVESGFLHTPVRANSGTLASAESLARALLHADLRPDDSVCHSVACDLSQVTRAPFVSIAPGRLLADAADRAATVLVADAATLAAAAVRQPGPRPDLSRLRLVLALGSPMTAEARARLYAWVKPDVLVLAQAGALMWGSPLDPVTADPGSPMRFLAA